jgi:hypothetical protein
MEAPQRQVEGSEYVARKANPPREPQLRWPVRASSEERFARSFDWEGCFCDQVNFREVAAVAFFWQGRESSLGNECPASHVEGMAIDLANISARGSCMASYVCKEFMHRMFCILRREWLGWVYQSVTAGRILRLVLADAWDCLRWR